MDSTRIKQIAGGAIAVPLLILGARSCQESDRNVSPPASIDATGASDVTVEMQSWLNSVPDKSTIEFPENAKYQIDGTLKVNKKEHWLIDGNGSTFSAKTDDGLNPEKKRNRSQWSVNEGTNIIFEDMNIRGSHEDCGPDGIFDADYEGQHGIEFLGTDNVEVKSVDIRNVFGDFLYVGRSADFAKSENVLFHENLLQCNGRQGIAVTHGDQVLIERNNISQVRRTTFDLEPNTPSQLVSNVTIRENQVGTGRLNFLSAAGRGCVNDVTITDNVLKNKHLGITMNSPEGERCHGVTIIGNKSETGAGNPRKVVVWMVQYDEVEVISNRQQMNERRDMHMVGSQNSCYLTVRSNDIAPNGTGQLLILDDKYKCPAK